MKDRDDLIRSVWLYYVFFHPHAALEQLRAGFTQTLQMELITTCYAEQLRDILVTSDAFNPNEVDLIDEVIIKYSDSGSNDRRREEDIILFWTEFITSCGVSRGQSHDFIVHCAFFTFFICPQMSPPFPFLKFYSSSLDLRRFQLQDWSPLLLLILLRLISYQLLALVPAV